MCNCCPPTVNALFCLWVQSGCSKATVAGALTFFPPDPPLYTFERYNAEGELITDEDDEYDEELNPVEAVGDNENGDEDNTTTNKQYSGRKPSNREITSAPSRKSMAREDDNPNDEEEDDDIHPAKALTDRALALRKLAKVKNQQDAKDDANNVTYKFIPDPRLVRPPSYSGNLEAVKIGPHPKTKSYIAALVYRVREDRLTDQTKTIIYSHGNATDIGAMYFMQIIMAKGLQCNIIMYDYSGYGESGGVPLEHNTYNDIEMVYDYALDNVVKNKEEKNLIVYGQSVGSGPSCYICNKRPEVGGLILHSPFMSGMRVLTPSRALACLDIFPNINRIKNVQCPVMIIHGQNDEEVSIEHGKELHDAVPEEFKRPPWWVRGRGHNDITDGRSKLIEYIQKLKTFLDSLERS